MFEKGEEHPLPQGTPCKDLDGKKIRGGIPFSTMGTILNTNAAEAGAVVVRTAPGNQLFFVELADLIAAGEACDEAEAIDTGYCQIREPSASFRRRRKANAPHLHTR